MANQPNQEQNQDPRRAQPGREDDTRQPGREDQERAGREDDMGREDETNTNPDRRN